MWFVYYYSSCLIHTLQDNRMITPMPLKVYICGYTNLFRKQINKNSTQTVCISRVIDLISPLLHDAPSAFCEAGVQKDFQHNLRISVGCPCLLDFTCLHLVKRLFTLFPETSPDSKVHKVHGANMGPTGPRWAPCWLHELYYLGPLSERGSQYQHQYLFFY